MTNELLTYQTLDGLANEFQLASCPEDKATIDRVAYGFIDETVKAKKQGIMFRHNYANYYNQKKVGK